MSAAKPRWRALVRVVKQANRDEILAVQQHVYYDTGEADLIRLTRLANESDGKSLRAMARALTGVGGTQMNEAQATEVAGKLGLSCAWAELTLL